MTTHFTLDYTTPFGVGDEIYTTYPACEGKHVGWLNSYARVRGRISAIKLVLEHNSENSCVVKQATGERSVQVEQVLYTILPLDPTSLSAFTVVCLIKDGKPPKLFATESELADYHSTNPH